ncbi:MAG: hypothetical protein IKM39_03105, partial [Clostridia bacterium]|nr:hypothetical protein [Clostridia bacterium]
MEIAAKKTEKTVEVQKIRFAVQKQKNKVSKAYETLGRCYFEGRTDESSKNLLDSLCADLELELSKLKELKIQLVQLKNKD